MSEIVEERFLTLCFLCITAFFAVLTGPNMFSVIYFSASLVAVNMVLAIRRYMFWCSLVGTILALLHVANVYTFMVSTTINPYLLVVIVLATAMAVIPGMLALSPRGRGYFIFIPPIAALILVAAWFWMRREEGFDALGIDLVCIVFSSGFLISNSLPDVKFLTIVS